MKEIDGAPESNFIRDIIKDDLANDRTGGKVATRFPPEPNGYLHIGHAKSICLNFGLASEFEGTCNLRFDDTNPSKENQEYIDSIIEDVHWLGFDWGDRQFFASDYFDQLYEWALELIRKGLAYVDDLSAEEIRKYRGTLKEPGKPSPYRDRTVEENLDLFQKMRDGEFPDGAKVLRAKIDMASPNMNMRDPAMYRIVRASHHRTGDKWCIYPMYDWAHGQSDSMEHITHSLCTLEFENHRPLYDWFLDHIDAPSRPHQYEFARLNLTFTVLSKRKLLQLVEDKHVEAWDDPRMPTISGLRRRGYTPESIRKFCDRIGVSKRESTVDVALLEHAIRDDLNTKAPRVMGVLNPLKIVLTNYPEDQEEKFNAPHYPDDPPAMGSRDIPFCREIYIEQDDFMEDPPKKFFRLAPGREVRLRWAYVIKCQDVVKDDAGNVVEVHCTYDPETKGGNTPDGRRIKGTIHWVSACHAFDAQVRLYDRLFLKKAPGAKGRDFIGDLNPDSLKVMDDCKLEPCLSKAEPGQHYQFERLGYFFVDPKISSDTKPVFNRTVPLRDSWAKLVRSGKAD